MVMPLSPVRREGRGRERGEPGAVTRRLKERRQRGQVTKWLDYKGKGNPAGEFRGGGGASQG